MILKTTPVTDKKIIGTVTRKKIFRSDILETVEMFISSGEVVVEVDNSMYKNRANCTTVIKECIKRNRISNVDCVTKNGKTYMFRTDMGEDE